MQGIAREWQCVSFKEEMYLLPDLNSWNSDDFTVVLCHELWTHICSVLPFFSFLDQPLGFLWTPLHHYELVKSKVCKSLHEVHFAITWPHSCH